MRKIKFRAWDSRLNTMWYFGLKDIFSDGCEVLLDMIKTQFTGLLDINNRDIYDGDIVEFIAFNITVSGVVQWDIDDGLPCFMIVDTDGSGTIWDFTYPNLKVIGNIYENPELL